jgi:hypothetical protein
MREFDISPAQCVVPSRREIGPAINKIEWAPDNLLDLFRVRSAIMRDEIHEIFNIWMKIPQEKCFLFKMKERNFLILCA